MSNWLEFITDTRKPGNKTDSFTVKNKITGVLVGRVYWYGGFRKYVFGPADNCIFDSSCMTDIGLFLDALMQERKVLKQKA